MTQGRTLVSKCSTWVYLPPLIFRTGSRPDQIKVRMVERFCLIALMRILPSSSSFFAPCSLEGLN